MNLFFAYLLDFEKKFPLFLLHVVMAKNGLDEMLCQGQKSPINAIKSRNFAIDFVEKPYYNGRRNFEKGTNRIV